MVCKKCESLRQQAILQQQKYDTLMIEYSQLKNTQQEQGGISEQRLHEFRN